MKNIYVISFLKILTGLLGLVFWAAIKWSKERYKLRIIKTAILDHIKNHLFQDRLLYNEQTVGKFMEKNHPQTIFFIEELCINALRPIYMLTLVLLFFYSSVIPFLIFLIGIVLIGFLAEMNLDELKTSTLFRLSLVGIWIITFIIICYSEYQIQNIPKPEHSINDSIIPRN